jgi:hypothetical protein
MRRELNLGDIIPSMSKNSPTKIFNQGKLKDGFGGKYPKLLLCPLFGS